MRENYNFNLNTNFYNNPGIKNKKKINNSSIELLKQLNQEEKEEYLIYIDSKYIYEDEDDNESEENYREEISQIRIFGKKFVEKNKNNCKIMEKKER